MKYFHFLIKPLFSQALKYLFLLALRDSLDSRKEFQILTESWLTVHDADLIYDFLVSFFYPQVILDHTEKDLSVFDNADVDGAGHG